MVNDMTRYVFEYNAKANEIIEWPKRTIFFCDSRQIQGNCRKVWNWMPIDVQSKSWIFQYYLNHSDWLGIKRDLLGLCGSSLKSEKSVNIIADNFKASLRSNLNRFNLFDRVHSQLYKLWFERRQFTKHYSEDDWSSGLVNKWLKRKLYSSLNVFVEQILNRMVFKQFHGHIGVSKNCRWLVQKRSILYDLSVYLVQNMA